MAAEADLTTNPLATPTVVLGSWALIFQFPSGGMVIAIPSVALSLILGVIGIGLGVRTRRGLGLSILGVIFSVVAILLLVIRVFLLHPDLLALR